MKIAPIIHQQIVQLRWHFLASLGLIMVLPIEDALVNLKEGVGFYAAEIELVGISLCFAPLLAGLIACANIQADLDDKRHIFWRSKPVRIKSFMTIKYFVGLLMSMVLLACPVIFALISTQIVDPSKISFDVLPFFLSVIVITTMTYSLCFFANILVRKTARAWLIGMAATCFLLLTPYILPLNYKDISTDILQAASITYLALTLGTSVIAFTISLLAASRNWHIKTNLKGLLWTAAALIFLLMMLFTRQVANIKILDVINTKNHGILHTTNDRFAIMSYTGYHYVNFNNNSIELEPIENPAEIFKSRRNMEPLYKVEESLKHHIYPDFFDSKLFFKSAGNTYSLSLHEYYYLEKIDEKKNKARTRHLYLHSTEMHGPHYVKQVAALDLSDLIHNGSLSNPSMRLIEDKLIILTSNDIFAVVQVDAQGGLQLLEKNNHRLRLGLQTLVNRNNIFKLPLIATQQISIEQRIKLTIDYIHGIYDFPIKSIVDIHGDQISFARVSEDEVTRYDVVEWDDEFVYCQYNNSRHFTFLEQMFDSIHGSDNYFVKDGKLYAHNDSKLMIFDLRSNRIRKLGHFERLSESFRINDIEVSHNSNIIMQSLIRKHIVTPQNNRDWTNDSSLYLLKNPE